MGVKEEYNAPNQNGPCACRLTQMLSDKSVKSVLGVHGTSKAVLPSAAGTSLLQSLHKMN